MGGSVWRLMCAFAVFAAAAGPGVVAASYNSSTDGGYWHKSPSMTNTVLHEECMEVVKSSRNAQNQELFCVSWWFSSITTDSLGGKDSASMEAFMLAVRKQTNELWPELTVEKVSGMWVWDSKNESGAFCSLWISDEKVAETILRDMEAGKPFQVVTEGSTLAGQLADVNDPTAPRSSNTTTIIVGAVAGTCALVLLVVGALTWQRTLSSHRPGYTMIHMAVIKVSVRPPWRVPDHRRYRAGLTSFGLVARPCVSPSSHPPCFTPRVSHG